MGGACCTYRGKGNAFSVSVGKQEGRRPLARFKRAWEYNIKKDVKGME
jgi:hypothetical protein